MAQNNGSFRRSLNKVIIKQGYLKKAPTSHKLHLPLIKSWDKKWVVFGVLNGESAYLEYYDTEGDIFRGTPSTVIELRNIKHITYTMQGQKYDYEFHIGLQDRVVTLVAESRDEMFAWCNALNLKLRELGLIGRKENDYMALPTNLQRPQEIPESSELQGMSSSTAPSTVNNIAPRRPPPPLPPLEETEVTPQGPAPLDDDFNPRAESPTHTNDFHLSPHIPVSDDSSSGGGGGDRFENLIDSIIREHRTQRQVENPMTSENSQTTSHNILTSSIEEEDDSDYEDNLLTDETANHLMSQNYDNEMQSHQLCSATESENQSSSKVIPKPVPVPRQTLKMGKSLSADQIANGSHSVRNGSSLVTNASNGSRNVNGNSSVATSTHSYHGGNSSSTYEALWEVSPPTGAMNTSANMPNAAFNHSPNVQPPLPRRRTKLPSASSPQSVPLPFQASNLKRSTSCPTPPEFTYTSMSSPEDGFQGGGNAQRYPNKANEVDLKLAQKLRELEGPEVNYGPGGPPPLEEAPPPYTPPRPAYMPGMVPVRAASQSPGVPGRTAGQSPVGGVISPVSSSMSPNSTASPVSLSGDTPPPPLPVRSHSQISRRSVPSPEEPGPLPPRRLNRGISLKESQVQILKNEMAMQGVSINLRKSDCIGSIGLVDCFGTVWVAGWNMKDRPSLHNAFHVGDNIISVNGHTVHSAQAAQKAIKHCDDYHKVKFWIRRVPHGRVYAIRRSAEGESLGFKREGGTAEIVQVVPDGLAARHGLTTKARSIDGTTLCNWSLTEVNNRPLNLFFKDNEVEHRLNAVGKDISLLVQPYDFIKAMKKALKSLKNYKEFIVQ